MHEKKGVMCLRSKIGGGIFLSYLEPKDGLVSKHYYPHQGKRTYRRGQSGDDMDLDVSISPVELPPLGIVPECTLE